MNCWYISGNRWVLCEVVKRMFGTATVRLYTGETRTGKIRQGLYSLLIEAV